MTETSTPPARTRKTATPPEDTARIDTAQMRRLHGLLRDHGITGDRAVHDYLTTAGHPVESRSDLGKVDAARLIAELEAAPLPTPTGPGGHPSLAAALVAFQAEMPKVGKAQTADMGSYAYKYADLADVSDAATPLLTKHGLAFLCLPGFTDNGNPILGAKLLHASGDYETASLPLHGRTAQEIGSSITYGRRYLLGCMTGIVTDEDDDGSLAQAARDRAQPAPPRPEPHQEELLAELAALSEDTQAIIRERWPFPGRGPTSFTVGEANQVRALVDVVIGETTGAGA